MRNLFNVPDNYFLSHSVGCLPHVTPDVLQDTYFLPWREMGGAAWPAWMEILEDFRSGLSALFNTAIHNICPQTNVSSALTKIIHALPKRADRNTILCSVDDFPTIGFVLQQAERAGYTVRMVEGDPSNLVTWLNAMDDTVSIIHITHAFSNTSKLTPVKQLCDIARDKGIFSIVDIAQSAGILPIDLAALQPDFAIGTGVKYLCFGPGACFLYASDKMIETSQPIDVGWFSHEQPFEMNIRNFRYADTAMRFFGGTPSPAPFAMANAALKLWHEIGLDKTQGRAQNLLDRLASAAPNHMLVSPSASTERGGSCVIAPDDREAFRTALDARRIAFDERAEGFRFSVHGYTSDADIETLCEAFSKLR